ncbi:NADPH-dependent oxidoreductase [Niallia nealsonii]|uniref:NADPH-dependent oxidoreductase n=1 Tax=Niallia nealsonii TaxID=115979 RepID=A0A2N0YX34_9BACI|nr:NADPH-dependent oxidoreductase [Niallia nealsonii]PKG21810.1 NADPH-dependent oxidoreductase [Niallia nealsonii]
MNQVIETLKNHRSYRKYSPKSVSADILETIVEAAQASPSWINGQQVSVIVVQDKSRKDRLAELCGNQKHINEAPVFLIFCADFYRAKLASEMEDTQLEALNDIDALLVGATDVGLAMANAITAAESLELGTVPIGGIRRNSLEVVDFLQLPKYVIPISGLCLGYPTEDPGIKPRLPKESIIHKEIYNQDQLPFLQAYNETFKTYLKDRGDTEANWTDRVAKFYSQSYYPSNADMLKKQGFPAKDLLK